MSGVLARMILRTRSALAGIEPLFALRYASSEGFHEAANRPVEAAESVVRRAPAPRQPARAARIILRDRAAAPSSPVTPEFSEEGARAISSPRHAPVVDEMPGPRSVADHVHVSLADLSSDAPATPLPTTSAQQEEPAAGEPFVDSVRTRSSGAETPCSTRNRMALGHDSASRAGPVVEAFDEGAAPAPISKKHSTPGAPPPPHVTISIGHVEVRAAPVSQPARRPAFRPRVTLDDYLRRSGDAR